MEKKERGASGFHRYYERIFPDRWAGLRAILEGDGLATEWSWSGSAGEPRYYLDPASLAVAHLLPLGERNLDLCAAPGGKTLVLAKRMVSLPAMHPDATLVANERSRERRARLHRVLETHLPQEVRTRLRITGHDATRWGLHEPDWYDAILADVPCSSERHVLTAPEALAQWSSSRISRLAVQQFAILAAAIDSLRAGGHVLYSTCALTTLENDAVLERALQRRGDKVEILVLDPGQFPPEAAGLRAGVERTTWGLQIMPDRCGGAGPMYCALLRRVS